MTFCPRTYIENISQINSSIPVAVLEKNKYNPCLFSEEEKFLYSFTFDKILKNPESINYELKKIYTFLQLVYLKFFSYALFSPLWKKDMNMSKYYTGLSQDSKNSFIEWCELNITAEDFNSVLSFDQVPYFYFEENRPQPEVVVQEPIVEQPVQSQPEVVVQEPIVEQPVQSQPEVVVQEPIVEQPVQSQPEVVVQEPIVEQPVQSQPVEQPRIYSDLGIGGAPPVMRRFGSVRFSTRPPQPSQPIRQTENQTVRTIQQRPASAQSNPGQSVAGQAMRNTVNSTVNNIKPIQGLGKAEPQSLSFKQLEALRPN
jgi:hypothetical protein